MDQKTPKDDIDRLEKLITKMKFEYEQYIRGAVKIAPAAVEREINEIIQEYSRKPPTANVLRFRFNNLSARFISFRQKIQRELNIKDGTVNTPFRNHDDKLLVVLDKLPLKYDRKKIIDAVNTKINELKSKGYTDIDVSLIMENGKPRLRFRTADEKETF